MTDLKASLRNHMEMLCDKIGSRPIGDHMIFAQTGIPAIAITASNIFSLVDTVIHTQDDDLKNIDFDILNKTVCFLVNCIK